ncbi:hypothetical protein L1D14_07615 [Vibrio tubiashii]|uniref:hypothetical protein n=1 Tax=Vibrio tubiashii TaxID=29498 RepID=UPI001EFCF2B3|nr:hypothetical protein [Vibrio tubiashii]MCG9576106.1 hypothetical protein [Vibrio tubiashii]
MECSIENEKLTHADLAADEKVVEVVQKYFRHSETKIPTMYKVEDGRLTASFNQIMNEAYTYTVENDANTWIITCIKPLSSGQVCPK